MSSSSSHLKSTSAVGPSSSGSIFRTGLSSSSLRATRANFPPANQVAPEEPQSSLSRPNPPYSGTLTTHHTSTTSTAAARPSTAVPTRSIYDKPRSSPHPSSASSIPLASSSQKSTTNTKHSTSSTTATCFPEDLSSPPLVSDAQWAAMHFTEAVNFSDFSVVGDMGSNCAVSVSGPNSVSTSHSTSAGSSSNGNPPSSLLPNQPSIFEVLDQETANAPSSSVAPSTSVVLAASKPPSSSSSIGRTTSNPFFSRSSSRIAPQAPPTAPAVTASVVPSPSTEARSVAAATPTITPSNSDPSLLPPTTVTTAIGSTSNTKTASHSGSSIDYQALYLAAQAESERIRLELSHKEKQRRHLEEVFAEKEKEFGVIRARLEHSTSLQGDKLAAAKVELEKKIADVERLKSQLAFANLDESLSSKGPHSGLAPSSPPILPIAATNVVYPNTTTPSAPVTAPPPAAQSSTNPRTSPTSRSPPQLSHTLTTPIVASPEPSAEKTSKKRAHSAITSPSAKLPSHSSHHLNSSLQPTKGLRFAEERAQKLMKLHELMPILRLPAPLPKGISLSQGYSSVSTMDLDCSTTNGADPVGIGSLCEDFSSRILQSLSSPGGPYVWLQSNQHIFGSFSELRASFTSLQSQVAIFQQRQLNVSLKLLAASSARKHLLIGTMLSESTAFAAMDEKTATSEVIDFILHQSSGILSLFSETLAFAHVLVSCLLYLENRRIVDNTDSSSLLKTSAFAMQERQALVHTFRLLAHIGISDPLCSALLLWPSNLSSHQLLESQEFPLAKHSARYLDQLFHDSSIIQLLSTLTHWIESVAFTSTAHTAPNSSLAATAVLTSAMSAPSPAASAMQRDPKSSSSLGDSTHPGSHAAVEQYLAPYAREMLEPLILLASETLSSLPVSLTIAQANASHSADVTDITYWLSLLHPVEPGVLSSRDPAPLIASATNFVSSELLLRCLNLNETRECPSKSAGLTSLVLRCFTHLSNLDPNSFLTPLLRQLKSILLSGWAYTGASTEESECSLSGLQSSLLAEIPSCFSEREFLLLGMSNRLQLTRLISYFTDSQPAAIASALASHSSPSGSSIGAIDNAQVELGAQLVISVMLAIEEAVDIVLRIWLHGPLLSSSLVNETASIARNSSKACSSYTNGDIDAGTLANWLDAGPNSGELVPLIADGLNFVQESCNLALWLLRAQPKYAAYTRSTEPELWAAFRSLESIQASLSNVTAGSSAHSSGAMWLKSHLPSCVDRLQTLLEDLAVIQERLNRSEM